MDIEYLKEKVLEQTDLSREISDEQIMSVIGAVLSEESKKRYLPLAQRVHLGTEIFNSLRKLDVLQELIEDPAITEIMINGTDSIFIEKQGRISKCEKCFSSRQKLEDVIQQIVAKSNRMVNETSPIADARLPDGSRVNVVLNPIALNGPIVTIRRFPKEPLRMNDLIRLEAIDEKTAKFLERLVAARYSIFICGGTGSGKTTFLGALSNYIPEDERIIVIEDNAELQIPGIPNLVRLEARNNNVEGCREISIRDLIKTSLRMRPDRIIIGEVRGSETIDLLQGLNSGHEGSMSTGHSNSPRDMISRLETMVLMGMDLPLAAIQRQIASAIDIIVYLGRLRDKSRKVLEIDEIAGYERGEIMMNPLYQFVEEREDKDGRIIGSLQKKEELIQTRKMRWAGITL